MAAGAHHRLGAHVRPRAAPPARGHSHRRTNSAIRSRPGRRIPSRRGLRHDRSLRQHPLARAGQPPTWRIDASEDATTVGRRQVATPALRRVTGNLECRSRNKGRRGRPFDGRGGVERRRPLAWGAGQGLDRREAEARGSVFVLSPNRVGRRRHGSRTGRAGGSRVRA